MERHSLNFNKPSIMYFWRGAILLNLCLGILWPLSVKGEPEGTEGVREPVGSYSSSTSSSTLERISTRLENDDFEERKRAVAELVAFIKREKDARPQEVAWARVELSRVLNGTYGDLLSETQRNQFNTLPLTQAERNALARGETLENGLLGLTPEERKKLEDYMWRRGQMITDVVNAERLVHEPWNPVPIDPALEAKEGEVIITNRAKQEAWKKIQREGTHGWEEFQQDRWNSIALQLEKAGIKGTLPTYQKLTQTQKDKLIRTLYDRSAEVALKIWQALPKQGLTQAQLDGMTVLRDDVRVFNPNEASSLKTKITQSANKLSRKADVFSQDDRGADSAMFPSPDQKISMKDYLALPVEHLDPAQVAELNETQQTIRGMKQEIAVTLLESPPLARQEIKDKDYTRYRMQQALGAAMQQAHEAVQTSLQASDDIAQDAVNNFETYRDKTIKVFQAIVDRLPESEREDFVPFLSSLKEPKTISGFGLALKKAESQLNEVQAPLEDRFATQYAQERAATRNLMDMVNDDGAYLSPETSQKAYQDLLSVYKGQSEFGEFDTVLHMGLDHRSPVVQKMALEEARAAYASSPQKLKETYVGYLERTMQADLEAEVKALCDGSLSESNTALVFRSHADQLRTRASGQKSNDALSAEKMSRVLGGYLSVLQRSPNCDQAERVAAELAEITGSTFVSELIPHKRELVGQMAAYCEESKKREGAVSPICKSLQDNHLHIPVAYQQDDAGRRQYAQGRVVACAQDSAYGVRVQDEAVYVCEAPNQTLLGMELSELHEDVGDAVNFYAKTHALSNDEAQKKLRSDYLQALRQKMVESLLQNLEISSSFVDAPKLQMAVEALSGLQNCGLQTPASAQLAQNFTQKINTASAHNQTATEVRERFLRSLLHINEDGVMEAYGPNDENAMEDFKNFVVLQDRKRSKTAAALSERDEQERLRIAQGPYGFLLDPYFKESIEAKAQFYGILPAFYEAAIPRGSRAKVGLAEVDQKIRLARQTGQPLKVSYWGSQETGGVQTYPIEVPTYDELQAQLKDKFHRHYDAIMNEMQRYCTQMSCQELDGTYDPGQFEQFQQSAIDASPLLEVATVGLRKSKDVLQACKTGESPDVNRDRTAAVLLLMRNENLRQAVLNDHPEYADLDCGLFLDVKAKTTEWPTLKAVLGQADMLATAALVTAAAVTTGGVGGAVVGGALGTLYTADAYGDWKAASATRVESSGAHYAHAMGTRATRAGQTLDQFAQANEDEKAAATQFYVAAGLTVLDVGVGAGALRRMLARERAVNQMAEQIGQSRNLQAQLGAFSAKDGNAAAIRRAGSAQRAFAEQVVDREMGKPVSALARGWKDYYGEGARRSRRPMRSTVASGSVEPLDVRPKVSETPIVDAGKTRSQWRVPSEASSKESAEVLPMESSGGLGKSQSAVSAKGSASVAEAPKATAPQAKATPAVEASDESLFRSTGETPVVSRPKVAEAPKATAPQAKVTPTVEASDESLFRSTEKVPLMDPAPVALPGRFERISARVGEEVTVTGRSGQKVTGKFVGLTDDGKNIRLDLGKDGIKPINMSRAKSVGVRQSQTMPAGAIVPEGAIEFPGKFSQLSAKPGERVVAKLNSGKWIEGKFVGVENGKVRIQSVNNDRVFYSFKPDDLKQIEVKMGKVGTGVAEVPLPKAPAAAEIPKAPVIERTPGEVASAPEVSVSVSSGAPRELSPQVVSQAKVIDGKYVGPMTKRELYSLDQKINELKQQREAIKIRGEKKGLYEINQELDVLQEERRTFETRGRKAFENLPGEKKPRDNWVAHLPKNEESLERGLQNPKEVSKYVDYQRLGPPETSIRISTIEGRPVTIGDHVVIELNDGRWIEGKFVGVENGKVRIQSVNNDRVFYSFKPDDLKQIEVKMVKP